MQSPIRTLEPSRSTSILLRGGVILQHDSGGSVTGRKADVLISGDRITQIHPKISPPSDETTIINCHDKLISPGFIDTHRHMWQTQLKGRHGNHNLAEYIPTGHLTGGLYSPEDVFLGELGAAAESIDAGTTTVVDHAHVALSPPHVLRAIDGLVASGLRAFFCLVPTIQAESWKPVVKLKDTLIPDWFLPLLENLAEQMPMADGRIKLGLGFDGFHLPREEVVGLYQQAKKHGIKLFTSHHCRGPIVFDAINPLTEYGLLGPNIIISHATRMTDYDAARISAAGAFISSTPSTELQMGLGEPVCLKEDFYGISSLGVDCHSVVSASLVNEARLILQHSRAMRVQEKDVDPGTQTSKEFLPIMDLVRDVFNLITINGAQAISMGDQLGQVQEGMLADLVVWDATSPGMLAAAQHDPVAAIILHSSIRDVDTVIVNGVLRKHEGKLMPFHVNQEEQKDWKTVSKDILDSRGKLERLIQTTCG